MAENLMTSLLSLATKLLPSIAASAQAPTSSSNSNNSEKRRSHAFEEEMKSMMQTLERIKDTLYDAEEREIRDRSVKRWLKELKQVAYEAEDLLSEYWYEVEHFQAGARNTSQTTGSHKRKHMEYIEYIVPIPDGLVDRLNKIRSRFDEIAKDRDALQLRESDGVRPLNNNQPQTSHMVDEASIFGRDAEINEVIDFLLSGKEKRFSVISIVGKGGLGKTTIAQLAYKNLRDSQCFDLFGWVCVSEEFDVGTLTKATIESVSKVNYGLTELSALQDKLAETVKGKTILLVLDDVWNENESLWKSFQIPFREAKLVRILVTTRNTKVVEVTQTTACLSPTNMDEYSCWQLFQHYAFSGTSCTVPTHLVGLGREILRKCGGLPLAVKSIASLLRREKDEEDWRDILDSDLWEKGELKEDIFPALQISYAHLPAYLKPCFLFFSTYPKDFILEKMNLIELWISHGYIKSQSKRRITEVGAEYYDELKQRSFIDDFIDLDTHDFSKCCKLHDIIHDLARLNSENEHYSVEISQPHDMQKGIFPLDAYHLYVGGFMGYVNQMLQQNRKGLRTLSIDLRSCSGDFEHEYCLNNTETMDLNSKLSEYHSKCSKTMAICNLSKFEALRVLQLKGDFTNIPDSICKLKHLVYLGITSFALEILPLSIGRLSNLKALYLKCLLLEELPESISDLAKLQFLYISAPVSNLARPLRSLSNLLRLVIIGDEEITLDLSSLNTIGSLSSLEEVKLLGGSIDYAPCGLVNFPVIKKMTAWFRVRTIAWLMDMEYLEGKLSIEALENMSNLVDARCANLKSKCKLETLELCWGTGNYSTRSELILSLIPEGCEGRLGCIDDVDFSLLECLQPHPNLKKLRLRSYPSATIPTWVSDPFSLQLIQQITLEYCHNITSLPFGNLHSLKRLMIQTCDSIRVLQLEKLPSQLEGLEITWCGHLELITGLGKLDMLATLKILYCNALKSLTMDGLQLVESTEPFGDCSHQKSHFGQQSISSLASLEIKSCPLLHVLPDGLIQSRPRYVDVHGCGCPDLKIGRWQILESGIFDDLLSSIFHKEHYRC